MSKFLKYTMDPIEEDMYDLIMAKFGNNPPRLRIRTMKEIENRQRDEMIIDELAALRSHAPDFAKEVKWENEREREALHQYDFTTPFEWNRTPSYQPTQVDDPHYTWESTYVSTYGTSTAGSVSDTPGSTDDPLEYRQWLANHRADLNERAREIARRALHGYGDLSQSHSGSTQSITF